MKTKRQAYLDTVRLIAIISVVVDHAVMVGYRLFYDGLMDWWNSAGVIQQISMCFLWEFSRLGVLLFLMITGALILNKDFGTKESILKFYRNNLFPLVIINIVWVIIYRIISLAYAYLGIEFIYNGAEVNLSWKSFIYELLFMARADFPNSWYIPMIIGMYIFLPMVSIVIHSIDKKILQGVLGFTVLIWFIFPSINTVLRFLNIDFAFSTLIAMPYGGGPYGVAIILGYLLSNYNVANWYLGGGIFSGFTQRNCSNIYVVFL